MRRGTLLRSLGVAFIVIWTIVPIYWAINISLQTTQQATARPSNYLPPTPSLNNYAQLFLGNGDLAVGIRTALGNSTLQCALATALTIVLATLAAYAFARFRFRGRTLLFGCIVATLALPAYTTLIPIYQIFASVGIVNTHLGVIIVYCSGFLPLATWILNNYITGLPAGLEEAGELDGASKLQVLWYIVLPLVRPAIVSTALITFLFAWAQFLFPLVLSTDISTQPLTVAIAALQGRRSVPVSLMSAAGVVALAVPALIALVANRHIVNGMLAGSTK
ncbi:MAG: carbohydrate ABC transporter permease [Propionicimonas sp.]